MPFRFNPLTSELDLVGASSTSNVNIPEYTSDPSSPAAESAWVLYTGSGGGGSSTPGGDLVMFIGGFPVTTPATSSGGGDLVMFIGGFPVTTAGTMSGTGTYTLKYRTLEGTTVSTTLS